MIPSLRNVQNRRIKRQKEDDWVPGAAGGMGWGAMGSAWNGGGLLLG